MKKVLIILIVIFMCLPTFKVYAEEDDWLVKTSANIIGTEDNVITIEDNEKIFFTDGRNILSVWGVFKGTISMMEGGDIVGELPRRSISVNGKDIKGKFEYPNLDNTRLGIWDLEWIFTPENPDYPIVKGVQSIDVRESEKLKQERILEAITLTKSKLSLESDETFDINIKSKVKGSKYTWTTSNKKIATVNKKNGIVTAVKKGKAVITCKVTLPDGSTKTLKANVTVK